MTISLPLYYCGVPVNHALVDEELGWLLESPYHFHLDIPMPIQHYNPSEVILSMLELPENIQRCHPVLYLKDAWGQFALRLTTIVCLERTHTLLKEHSNADPDSQLSIAAEIRDSRTQLVRVIHSNRNRVDCRLTNLRPLIDQGQPS